MMNQGMSGYDSSFQDPPIASILLYSFLENSPNCAFASELCALKNQLLGSKLHFESDAFDDGELQTDGNRIGQLQDREPEEEIFRIIGAQLAEIGDKLAAEIEAPFVHRLAQQFMVENMSKEEVTRHLSQAVQVVVQRMPLEMEQERAMLLAAMVLAKKVANVVPPRLQQVFNTTINYINNNLHDYVNNLAPES
ncbi:BH3-interacting domain death agonist [Rhineura floridana]|uniref:BH3-interacting domain death agonist n=1 Tax=Rhineura floridana TaxID=261503 RepID=UPI002AC84862|nr:BH3-interacting domain death agonist [Rhineura floridana]XP_061494579.1 BH3-interacting domain death agonist [Rhineura floridana]